jgi:hypothetical protein
MEGKRREAIQVLESRGASQHLIELIRTGGALDVDEQSKIFGESLPKGLKLVEVAS